MISNDLGTSSGSDHGIRSNSRPKAGSSSTSSNDAPRDRRADRSALLQKSNPSLPVVPHLLTGRPTGSQPLTVILAREQWLCTERGPLFARAPNLSKNIDLFAHRSPRGVVKRVGE
jgi:hypothetical protein